MSKELLRDVIGRDEVKEGKFARFCEKLLAENEKFNITAIRNEDGVYLKHFCDSLAGKDFFASPSTVLEIGSGGGFPSVPLKINDEGLNFTLVESNAKKCGFLNSVKELLAFDDFNVVNARAEEFALANIEKFDYVTARAVAPSAVLCELALPCLKIGGKGVFYKNFSFEEIESARRAAQKLGANIASVHEYSLDGVDGKRCVIIIEKTKSTPSGYPRAYNKLIKKPLA